MVTDTTAVMPVTAKLLNLRWFGCIPHIINLVVNDGLKSCSSLLKSVRDIVHYMRLSGKANNKLKKMQQKFALPEHKVIVRYSYINGFYAAW